MAAAVHPAAAPSTRPAVYPSGAMSRAVIAVYRLGHWAVRAPRVPLLWPGLWLLYRLLDLMIVRIAAGSYLPARCSIGPGLRLPHPQGIILHGQARLGADVVLFQQVTVGLRDLHSGVPTIGDGALLGAGARVLGAVCVGAGARVGAGAVVLRDVPPGAVAVGVPAVIRRPRSGDRRSRVRATGVRPHPHRALPR